MLVRDYQSLFGDKRMVIRMIKLYANDKKQTLEIRVNRKQVLFPHKESGGVANFISYLDLLELVERNKSLEYDVKLLFEEKKMLQENLHIIKEAIEAIA